MWTVWLHQCDCVDIKKRIPLQGVTSTSSFRTSGHKRHPTRPPTAPKGAQKGTEKSTSCQVGAPIAYSPPWNREGDAYSPPWNREGYVYSHPWNRSREQKRLPAWPPATAKTVKKDTGKSTSCQVGATNTYSPPWNREGGAYSPPWNRSSVHERPPSRPPAAANTAKKHTGKSTSCQVGASITYSPPWNREGGAYSPPWNRASEHKRNSSKSPATASVRQETPRNPKRRPKRLHRARGKHLRLGASHPPTLTSCQDPVGRLLHTNAIEPAGDQHQSGH